jgi:histidine ammonia-lyase
MILEYLAQDALARARILATPVSTGHASVSLGLEEHASFSTQAVWASEQLVELAPVVLGCELVAAVRALRMDPARLPSPPGDRLRRVYDAAAGVLDEDRSDRPFTEDLAAAVHLVEDGFPD